ncbi:hypothetical protein PYCCODRAFT_1469685 [Trametes coccinea BRFM310]|uniref:Uncharacterized protein n=1 Tax=Trametes coccinea (strain BRFM310) TaxID=1353009 RepID=A0A1Y2IG44_TRAC3|nr:hypothetical protein PYCCODRAFT_1469685 [Trametes coccinea BRFM310]
MSAVATIDLRRALDIVEQTKAQNIDLAKNIYNATVQFMEAQGLTAHEELWYNKMEELAHDAHAVYALNTMHQLRSSVQLVHHKGGLAGLCEKVYAAMAMEREVGSTFEDLLDLYKDNAPQLSPAQTDTFYRTFDVVHRILLQAKDAEIIVLQFLRGNQDALQFLQYVHDNLQVATHPLRLFPTYAVGRHVRQDLDIVEGILDVAAFLLSATVEEAASAAFQLRAVGGTQFEQYTVDQKLAGLLSIRNKLIELQDSLNMRLETFSARLHSPPATLPRTLHGPAEAEFSIDMLLRIAAQFLRLDHLLETTHEFQEAQAMITSLLQATWWPV